MKSALETQVPTYKCRRKPSLGSGVGTEPRGQTAKVLFWSLLLACLVFQQLQVSLHFVLHEHSFLHSFEEHCDTAELGDSHSHSHGHAHGHGHSEHHGSHADHDSHSDCDSDSHPADDHKEPLEEMAVPSSFQLAGWAQAPEHLAALQLDLSLREQLCGRFELPEPKAIGSVLAPRAPPLPV